MEDQPLTTTSAILPDPRIQQARQREVLTQRNMVYVGTALGLFLVLFLLFTAVKNHSWRPIAMLLSIGGIIFAGILLLFPRP